MKFRRALFGLALALAAFGAIAVAVEATTGKPINPDSQGKYTLAVIGDAPYGAPKTAAFPQFIAFMNDDPKADLAVHLGDIKAGSTVCSNQYFEFVRDELERLVDPVVYTPGDNEWTDCHRANNGNYKPTERLEKLRELFFPRTRPDARRTREAGPYAGGRRGPPRLCRKRDLDGVEGRFRDAACRGEQR